MIRREQLKIISTRVIAKDTMEMILENEYIAHRVLPGQFIHIQVGTYTLRRPISIADCNKKTNELSILFKINGDGTKELANYQEGQVLDVLGPLGNGFPIDDKLPTTVLLVGGGIGVPPLYYLGTTLKELGINIVSILGFQDSDQMFYEQQFLNLGETIIVTDNGSYGQKGYVTDVLNQVNAFDTYYACGPIPMLKAVMKRFVGRKGFISLEERMGCGIGACLACVLPTKEENGFKKICKDGPVFPVQEVMI